MTEIMSSTPDSKNALGASSRGRFVSRRERQAKRAGNPFATRDSVLGPLTMRPEHG